MSEVGLNFYMTQIWLSSKKGPNTEQITKILAAKMEAKRKQKKNKYSQRETKREEM